MSEESLPLKQALRFVAEALPDKKRSKAEVLEEALRLVKEESHTKLVTKFVKLSPQCWATDRRSRYWTILRANFTAEEIIVLYLGQFPQVLTARQRAALKLSLMRKLGLSELDALRELERFDVRESTYHVVHKDLCPYLA